MFTFLASKPLPSSLNIDSYDGFGPPATTQPTTEHRVVASYQASSHAARKPTMTLLPYGIPIAMGTLFVFQRAGLLV